jgi:hypothetical protein
MAEVEPSLPAAVPASPVASIPLAATPVITGSSSSSEPKKRALPLALRIALPVVGIVCIFLLALELRTMFSIFGSGARLSTDATPPPAESTPSVASASDLGVDIYPGATALSSADHSTLMDNSVVSQSFVSSDEMPRVIDFYKTKMVGYASIYASGDGVVVSTHPSAKESVLIAISPARSGGKTRFTITNTTASSK